MGRILKDFRRPGCSFASAAAKRNRDDFPRLGETKIQERIAEKENRLKNQFGKTATQERTTSAAASSITETPMETHRREQIQRSLRSLAKSHAAQMALLEEMLDLVGEEYSLDPSSYFQRTPLSRSLQGNKLSLLVDRGLFSITLQGKACFLGNTFPFKFLSHLAQRPNRYVSYEDLLTDVWQGTRSDSAIRSVVKTLRTKLRQSGLADLASAIDGSVFGHYALKL